MFTRISENLGSRGGAETRRKGNRAAPAAPPFILSARDIRAERAQAASSPRLRVSARTLFLLVPALLTACGSSSKRAPGDAADSGQIDCAPQGAGEFKRVCTLDRVEGANGLELVVHNPDGGFHRLRVAKDGRGVIAADGAEDAKVTIVGTGEIEVAIGGDRYRLPATVKGQSPS